MRSRKENKVVLQSNSDQSTATVMIRDKGVNDPRVNGRKNPFTSGSSNGTVSGSDPQNILNKAASASSIRSKLLTKLGVHRPCVNSQTPSQPSGGVSILEKEKSREYVLPLNGIDPDDSGSPRILLSKSWMSSLSQSTRSISSLSSDGSLRRNRTVSFDENVHVHTIPKHSDYSSRIRHYLWTPPSEMAVNAARNCVEYAAEGWNPENVFLDEDMVLYEGEKVHPVHFAQECNLNQHFCQVMSQRQEYR